MQKNKNRFASVSPERPSQNLFSIGKPGYNDRYPEFSFKYYANNHHEYSVKCITHVRDFHEMFDRLKTISSLRWFDIKKALHQYHFHEIEWAESDEPSGFADEIPRTLRAYPACQFKLFQECRIIGFFNSNNIFEIVWIDRYHKVYKRK